MSTKVVVVVVVVMILNNVFFNMSARSIMIRLLSSRKFCFYYYLLAWDILFCFCFYIQFSPYFLQPATWFSTNNIYTSIFFTGFLATDIVTMVTYKSEFLFFQVIFSLKFELLFPSLYAGYKNMLGKYGS